jgi:hypothetical protein
VLGVRLTTPPHEKCFVEKLLKFETGQQFWKRLKSTKDCNATRIIIILKICVCEGSIFLLLGKLPVRIIHCRVKIGKID